MVPVKTVPFVILFSTVNWFKKLRTVLEELDVTAKNLAVLDPVIPTLALPLIDANLLTVVVKASPLYNKYVDPVDVLNSAVEFKFEPLKGDLWYDPNEKSF